MIFLLLSLIVLAFLIYKYRKYVEQFNDIDKLPGPSTFKLIKELYFNSSSKGIITYILTLSKTHGPIVKFWMKPFRPMIIATDIDFVDALFKAKDHHITPTLFEMTFMGEGVASNPNYDNWKKDKQIIVKTITNQYIGKKLRIYDQKLNELLELIRCNPEKPIDLEKHLNKILLEILINTFEHPQVELNQEEIMQFSKSRSNFFTLLMEKMNSFRCMGIFHRFTKNYELIWKSHNEIVEFGNKWLEKFKNVEEHLRDKKNLVYAMMEGGIPDNRVVDNMNTIIQGGHDTTILPLTMALREMAQRPEIQKELLNEIVNVIGPDITKEITLEDLNKMPYLQAIAKESVRLYVPLPFIDRLTLYDMTINGIKIPANTRVMFNLQGIMTSEDNYKDALAFRPERFLKENVTSRAHKAFVGFGYGPKACAGKFVAYAAIKLLLVKIVREFEVLHVDHDVQLVSEVFFRSLTGIPVAFRKRCIN